MFVLSNPSVTGSPPDLEASPAEAPDVENMLEHAPTSLAPEDAWTCTPATPLPRNLEVKSFQARFSRLGVPRDASLR
jgi:hypothetical protein